MFYILTKMFEQSSLDLHSSEQIKFQKNPLKIEHYIFKSSLSSNTYPVHFQDK